MKNHGIRPARGEICISSCQGRVTFVRRGRKRHLGPRHAAGPAGASPDVPAFKDNELRGEAEAHRSALGDRPCSQKGLRRSDLIGASPQISGKMPLPAGEARQEGETKLDDGGELREGCPRNRFEMR